MNTLVEATAAALEAAGKLDSVLGQQALRLASALAKEGSGSGLAALSRELRATMVEALDGARSDVDPVDELKARRAARRAG